MTIVAPNTLVQGFDGSQIPVLEGVRQGWYRMDANGNVVIPANDQAQVLVPTQSGLVAMPHAYAGAHNGLNPVTAPTTTTAPTTPNPQQPATPQPLSNLGDARGRLAQELTGWGFGQDAVDWAWGELISGKAPDQVLFDLRQQPFWKNSIFGKVNAARTAAGLPFMAESDVLAYRDLLAHYDSALGLQKGTLNNDAVLARLAGSGVSARQLDERLTTEYQKAAAALPVVAPELAKYYGLTQDQITPGALALYYAAPDIGVPALHKQLQAAQIGSQARLTGYGDLSRMTAEQLTAMGVTPEQAQAGFSDIARVRQWWQPMPGSQPVLDQQTAFDAQFNKDAEAQKRMQLAGDTAKAPFNAAQRFVETAAGQGGVGQAQSA